jgi:murein DD-endopeptidase MepM/ murein hydrolase activator NlpD
VYHSSRRTRAPWVLVLGLIAVLALPSAALAAFGDRTLAKGMSGSDVTTLQKLVTKLRYPTPVTGTFDARTDRDIRHYERSTGLRADGRITPAEASAIKRRAAAVASVPPSSPPPTYSFGERVLRERDKGGDVTTLQTLITKLGYPTTVDGVFSAGTTADVRKYELLTGLTVDGVVSLSESAAIKRRAAALENPPPPPTAPPTTHSHVFPIAGAHTFGGAGSRFGVPRSGHRHGGQDMPAKAGTPLVAVTNGVVSWKRYQAGGAGHYVVIRGDDRYDYVYMHMQSATPLAVGQRVKVGRQVGRVGSTGASSGPHLHFEIWPQGWYSSKASAPIDPLPQLQAWAGTR